MIDLERVADAVGRERVVHLDPHVVLIHARWQDVIDALPQVDAVITDPPYSEETHRGSDAVANGFGTDGAERAEIGYQPWSPDDVMAFADAAVAVCGGWIVAMTDDRLAYEYRLAYRATGRYDFASVSIILHKPRLGGDGPGSCTVHMQVCRPRTNAFCSWGSLPGWYKDNPSQGTGVQGAKPLHLMKRIVSDYSREGDLILDPCAGGGTTGRAAKDLGRQCILVEMDGETCEKAARVLRPHRAWQQEFAL